MSFEMYSLAMRGATGGVSRLGILESEALTYLWLVWGEGNECHSCAPCTQETLNACLMLSRRWPPSFRNAEVGGIPQSRLSIVSKGSWEGGVAWLHLLHHARCTLGLPDANPTMAIHLIKWKPILYPFWGPPDGGWGGQGCVAKVYLLQSVKGSGGCWGVLKWRQMHC